MESIDRDKCLLGVGQYAKYSLGVHKSVVVLMADSSRTSPEVRLVPILLQKSKVASVLLFGQIPKREEINDSYNLSRVTEVAYEFSERR
jgi:hypothetical protein